ncbi:4Fe-4S dicluster domain-containing protein [Desulfobacter latus]|uniref:4Fe-4S dicluster domain-containing protein n=1 Tax=Desulfobacter latus TaxID=2292 RepID=A0A850T4I8_9BACT|nr:4Fe-4S dicluster domain-containing protein [Desulfobacter latus]NWH03755.1 4Fe-4S dicluster domain-containing protein [Desulfobacter latus]
MAFYDLLTGPMLYTWSFFIALAIFLIGIIYRLIGFFRLTIGPTRTEVPAADRIKAFLAGLFGIIVSPARIFHFFKTLILDVVLQLPLMRQNRLKWVMHICIYWGFAWLFFFHALEGYISEVIFSNYMSTLNPFMALRNMAGVMVMGGIAIAIYRRRTHFRLKQISTHHDYLAIALLALIMISGFGLEAAKIISSGVFNDMVEEYGFMDYDEELPALKAVWQEEYNVYFPGESIPVTPEIIELGRMINEDNCAACHANPRWAFVSYPASLAIKPAAGFFNRNRLDVLLLNIHFLSCFIALAYLPFSKFLHILTTPVSLMISGLAGQQIKRDENKATRRIFDLSACTQCGTCTSHCAVGPLFEIFDNPWVFPSERVTRIRESAWGRPMDPELKEAFSQGSFICTMCNKCSQLCPAGLNLQDIWQATRGRLAEESLPDPVIRMRERRQKRKPEKAGLEAPVAIKPGENPVVASLKSSLQGATFSQCYTCLTCTSTCPVVGVTGETQAFGSAPHQVIHALILGQTDLAKDASIVWDCLTCYKCQENCPQGVRITDIFYQLRNMEYHQEFGI